MVFNRPFKRRVCSTSPVDSADDPFSGGSKSLEARDPETSLGRAAVTGVVGGGRVWYGRLWYGMIWYDMVWFSMVWFSRDMVEYGGA